MLNLLTGVLVIVWLFGILNSRMYGGLIHLLLVPAFLLVVVRAIRGQRIY